MSAHPHELTKRKRKSNISHRFSLLVPKQKEKTRKNEEKKKIER